MIKSLRSFSLRKYKKSLLIVLISIISLFLIGGTVAYFKREALLKKAIAKAINLAKSKYNLNVKIASYGFSGLSTVHFQNISIIPEKRDSLARIDDVTGGVKLFPLIFGKVKIAELGVDNALLSFVKKDSLSNYDFLFKKDSKDTVSTGKKIDLSELA